MGHSPASDRKEILTHTTVWSDLKGTVLSEISQTQKVSLQPTYSKCLRRSNSEAESRMDALGARKGMGMGSDCSKLRDSNSAKCKWCGDRWWKLMSCIMNVPNTTEWLKQGWPCTLNAPESMLDKTEQAWEGCVISAPGQTAREVGQDHLCPASPAHSQAPGQWESL